jgi:hypothetical protein
MSYLLTKASKRKFIWFSTDTIHQKPDQSMLAKLLISE